MMTTSLTMTTRATSRGGRASWRINPPLDAGLPAGCPPAVLASSQCSLARAIILDWRAVRRGERVALQGKTRQGKRTWRSEMGWRVERRRERQWSWWKMGARFCALAA